MKKILIDVDEVICHAGFLPLINEFLGTNYKLDEFKNYYIDDDVFSSTEIKKSFFDFYVKQDGYKNAELLDDAYEVLLHLNKSYDIYVCSAFVMDGYEELSGKFIMDKYNFLISKLPFLDPKKFIFTGAKNFFKGDIQIDDRLSNLKGDIPLKFMFTSYHNKNITNNELEHFNVIKVNGWKDLLTYLD